MYVREIFFIVQTKNKRHLFLDGRISINFISLQNVTYSSLHYLSHFLLVYIFKNYLTVRKMEGKKLIECCISYSDIINFIIIVSVII